MVIHPTTPCLHLPPQDGSIGEATLAQALPRKQTNGNLCLVQPTAVFGRVVHGEPFPQPASSLLRMAVP